MYRYSDGKSRNLERHERNKGHFQTVRKWSKLNKSIEKGVTVDSLTQNIIKKRNTYFKNELFLIQFLAGKHLLFRGNTQTFFEKDNGKFFETY